MQDNIMIRLLRSLRCSLLLHRMKIELKKIDTRNQGEANNVVHKL